MAIAFVRLSTISNTHRRHNIIVIVNSYVGSYLLLLSYTPGRLDNGCRVSTHKRSILYHYKAYKMCKQLCCTYV